jgi:hypothetical protein
MSSSSSISPSPPLLAASPSLPIEYTPISTPPTPDARPRPLFFIVMVLGLLITFIILLLITPAVMTQTTLDKAANEVISTRNKSKFVKIAMIADAGLNEASKRVLQLVKDEQCDMVLHSGDLDYQGNAEGFFRSVDEILGPKFPYFATMGNYEAKRGMGRAVAWEAYYTRLKDRLVGIDGLHCSVISMRNLACAYQGVSFVTSSIGVNSSRLGCVPVCLLAWSNHRRPPSLDLKELRAAQTSLWGSKDKPFVPLWRFCSWHLPLVDFQVGFREGVPWMSSPELTSAYENCRMRGAAILTGHEHYYVRSHSIRRFAPKAKDVRYRVSRMQVKSPVTNNSMGQVDVLVMAPGTSFAIVSGLGGHSVSIPSADRVAENPHLSVVHPKYLIKQVDPNGKYFYPAITGPGDPTSSQRIEATVDEKNGYPFGALICTLQQSVSAEAHGVCVFKTISGKLVDRFVLHRRDEA